MGRSKKDGGWARAIVAGQERGKRASKTQSENSSLLRRILKSSNEICTTSARRGSVSRAIDTDIHGQACSPYSVHFPHGVHLFIVGFLLARLSGRIYGVYLRGRWGLLEPDCPLEGVL